MKGELRPILEFLEGKSNKYYIPVYQRNYDWKKENCERLFNDLVDVVREDRRSHFFGSIVYGQLTDAGSHDFNIIDGQQRITTLLLLLIAICRNIEDGHVTTENDELRDMIWEEYIVAKWGKEKRKIRLKPIKKDCESFDSIVLNNNLEEYNQSSNITRNYMYFYNTVKNGIVSVDDLYEAITKLQIMDIFLHHYDDPQLIFESLNSTGLDLTEGDKIRNLVLMDLDHEIQEEYYDNYWNRIEENTNFMVSDFIRDYLTIKQGRISSKENVYDDFKKFYKEGSWTNQSLLSELLIFSKLYKQILSSCTPYESANKVLRRLSILEMTVSYPFIMAMLDYAQQETTGDGKMIAEALYTIEVFIYRRLISGYQTNALNKIFSTLHKDVMKLKKAEDNYTSVLVYVLLKKKGRAAMPDDETFIKNFKSRDIYHMQKKNRNYTFYCLENQDSREVIDVLKGLNEGEVSIEHIMPQTLNVEWQRELGEDYAAVHAEWLHTIGNLTLTAYNSKYSNRPFSKKKTMDKGFNYSAFRLNVFVKNCARWSQEEITQRADELCTVAKKLWAIPQTTFVPPAKEVEVLGLADDEELFTSRTVYNFKYKDTEYPVRDWADVFEGLLSLLEAEDSSAMYQYISNNTGSWCSLAPDGDRYSKIGEKMYFSFRNSTKSKIRFLKQLFAALGIDEDVLEFSLKPDRENGESEL